MSMIQVNVTFHYATLAKSETQGRLCSQSTSLIHSTEEQLPGVVIHCLHTLRVISPKANTTCFKTFLAKVFSSVLPLATVKEFLFLSLSPPLKSQERYQREALSRNQKVKGSRLTSCNSLRISTGEKKMSGIIRPNTAISQRRKLDSKVKAFVRSLVPPVYWVVVLGPKS